MVFRVPPAATGAIQGEVDYRLARASTIADYRHGILARTDVCDAHPELVRAGREVGHPVATECPVCAQGQVVHVTYVFGPRLPAHGRCITLRGELARLGRRPGRHVAYVVEVCRECSWNHLVRRFSLENSDESQAGSL